MTDELQRAFRDHKIKHGHPAARAVLHRVCGVGTTSEVPANKREAVIAALDAADSPKPRPTTVEGLVASAFAKFNQPRARTG